MTITLAITRYQATKCEDSFAELYHYIYSSKPNLVGTFAKRYKLDEHDVESMINVKIFEIADKFVGTADKFRNAVFNAIRVGSIDIARSRNAREKHRTEVMYEDADGTLNEIYEIITDAPTSSEEDFRITEIQKKHDQRQLTAYLLSNISEPTLTSALTFIETNSYRLAAKQIGTSNHTVKARIRKLAKKFDENRFGSYHDYFTVGTVHIG